MASIPVILVEPLRQALMTQGFPRETVGNDGTINPAGFLAGSFDSMQIRSNITPNIDISTAELLKDDGKGGNPLLRYIRPTIVLTGKGGTSVIAPYGPAQSGGWIVPFFVVGFLVGVGVLVGRATA